MSYGSEFVLTLFTSDPDLAARADRAGVNRIGIDLDRTGKHLRQSDRCWISPHQAADLRAIRRAVRRARIFARVDHVPERLADQIDELLALGADVLMLPMFHHADEAARFVELVAGRAEVSLLIETAAAAARVHEVVRLRGVQEIFIGLNDLHLSLGLRSHFEVLASPLLEMLAAAVRGAGIRFGFGGLGRVNDPSLPVPSGLVYPQYPRLGATSALVSRVFLLPDPAALDLEVEIALARRTLDDWHRERPEQLTAARDRLRDLLRDRLRPNPLQ